MQGIQSKSEQNTCILKLTTEWDQIRLDDCYVLLCTYYDTPVAKRNSN